MKKHLSILTILLAPALLLFGLSACGGGEAGAENADGEPAQKSRYTFSGGPSGGTFQYYASAVTSLADKTEDLNINMLARASGGSIENIRLVNSGQSDFAVAYSGHVFAGLNGNLQNDDRTYENVQAVAYLYGAPAQLVVRQRSDVEQPEGLAGKRVALGNAGSGAAYNAELFFKKLGVFDEMEREFLGYRNAAAAFQNRQIDAFWVFAGFPNSAVLEAALQNNIRLLDTYSAGEEAGLFEEYPYFTKVVIPAGTYDGQDEDVNTFQDAAIWVANKDVPEDAVYNLLQTIYSEEGLAHMVSVHKSAQEMSIEGGTKGIVTPLHPGAERFWREQGTLAEETETEDEAI